MFKDGKVFGKFNIVDFAIFGVIGLILVGFVFVKLGIHKPLSKISKGVKNVEFTVTTRAYDVTAEEDLFVAGEKTFITIRNVPYTALEIVEAKKEPAKEMFFNYDRPEVPYLIKNVAYPNRVQYEIKLKDRAKITSDGAVIGGNKIKIGLPVDLEGFKYRLSGAVSDVKIIEEE